ncbi:pyridoxamine 5'-phosphate oxidase family protein [Anaeromicropila populeti]|uniref:Pyridoxamine 5'-phosphate oxidase n=1 Tax=Anaeromicropila populeti TaxID=37658 RepID=A0A1I6HNC9_9FIRM|nr:pyridoxamine 5'-phosphate oxidase family protein [Anaeromicropila populeti]SFR55983.1 Pyridoxamine 5'-phosphate oxidase [Anaeromicropila populeti]
MTLTHVIYNNPDIPKALLQKVLQVSGPSTSQLYDENALDTLNSTHMIFLISPKCPPVAQEDDAFLNKITHILPNKKTAVLVLDSQNSLSISLLAKIRSLSRKNLLYSDIIDTSTASDEETAVKLLSMRRSLLDNQDMPVSLLNDWLKEMIGHHNTCTLCTGFGTNIRATPIEFTYHEEAFYFLSEGGEKFANLAVNPNVCIALYQEYSGFDKLEGIQVCGAAMFVDLFSEEYNTVITKRQLTPEQLKKLPVTLHMIKVLPHRFELLNSLFRKSGYEAKQVKELE